MGERVIKIGKEAYIAIVWNVRSLKAECSPAAMVTAKDAIKEAKRHLKIRMADACY